MTHAELVKIAAKFVKNFLKCPIVFTEPVTGVETPDVIGFKQGNSFLVECKASVADFNRDHKKWFRKYEGRGMGNFRYYMVPADILPIIKHSEESSWGLISVFNGKVQIQQPPRLGLSDKRSEVVLLQSCLRRLGADGIISFKDLRKKEATPCPK